MYMKLRVKDYKTNEIVKFIRQGANLTQQELAKKVKISKSSIEKYEYGTVNFTFETFVKILEACELDITIESKKNRH